MRRHRGVAVVTEASQPTRRGVASRRRRRSASRQGVPTRRASVATNAPEACAEACAHKACAKACAHKACAEACAQGVRPQGVRRGVRPQGVRRGVRPQDVRRARLADAPRETFASPRMRRSDSATARSSAQLSTAKISCAPRCEAPPPNSRVVRRRQTHLGQPRRPSRGRTSHSRTARAQLSTIARGGV